MPNQVAEHAPGTPAAVAFKADASCRHKFRDPAHADPAQGFILAMVIGALCWLATGWAVLTAIHIFLH